MNEEEYKTRINKINARLSTDRCSDDEIANLNIQRIYLKDKYNLIFNKKSPEIQGLSFYYPL